jgi:hypothetical protein
VRGVLALIQRSELSDACPDLHAAIGLLHTSVRDIGEVTDAIDHAGLKVVHCRKTEELLPA